MNGIRFFLLGSLLTLGVSACASSQRELPSEQDLYKLIEYDNYDDGYTPAVERLQTPSYNMGTSASISCRARVLRIVKAPGDLMYFLECTYHGKPYQGLDQVVDAQGTKLKFSPYSKELYSKGKEVGDGDVDRQQMLKFLVQLNNEQFAQALQANDGYRMFLKSSHPADQKVYAEGLEIIVPQALLRPFARYVLLNWK